MFIFGLKIFFLGSYIQTLYSILYGPSNVISLNMQCSMDDECPCENFHMMKFDSHLCYEAEISKVLQTVNMKTQQSMP